MRLLDRIQVIITLLLTFLPPKLQTAMDEIMFIILKLHFHDRLQTIVINEIEEYFYIKISQ